MDAFAVAIAGGVIIQRQHLSHALRFGIYFGLFQMVMPILGWAAGRTFAPLIGSVDHWVAFILLTFIGGRMVREAFEMDYIERSENCFTAYVLLGLAVATSIDALIVGLSFAFLNVDVITPAIMIGAVTFTLSFLGVLIGQKVGHLFEKKMEVVGGLVLIGIGLKILIEHLFK